MAHATDRTRPSDRRPAIRLSVVSHDQEELTLGLLRSLAEHCPGLELAVTVTINAGAGATIASDSFPFSLDIITNPAPKGFGANHNQALLHCGEEYVCILNPDIRFGGNPFDALLQTLQGTDIGIAGPVLVDSQGRVQDSARRFPTPMRILVRLLRRNHEYDCRAESLLHPQWIAGMFMVLPSQVFRRLGGFDPRYFLYCEDADLCRRAALIGLRTAVVTTVSAVHDARRSSHRSLRYLWWHVASLIRFFFTHPFYSL